MAKTSANKFRGPELAKIHIARADLGISEEIYRDMVRVASGGKTESSAKLTWQGRRALLERFAELGWKPRHAARDIGGHVSISRPLADFPEAKMARGLWIELHQLFQAGAVKSVKDPNEKALNAFVKRMTGVDDLHWLRRQGRVDQIIEALKAWLDRSRQQCFEAWLSTACPEPLPDVLRALLTHAACSLPTGAAADEQQRLFLGEGGWHLYVAYSQHLQTVIGGNQP